MSRLQMSILSLILVLLSVAATRFGGFPSVNDHHDIAAYFERGTWVTTGQQPYRDVFSEYPQVATWLFAVPHLVAEIWAPENETLQDQVQRYRYIFSGLMGLCLAGAIALLYTLRNDNRRIAFLLLLPAGWYFTHNRFDILPAFLTLVSLAALRRSWVHRAFFVLALATATKWYAVVMLPMFVAYVYHTNRRLVFSTVANYALVLFAIVLPTLITIGWQGFLIPYEFHMTRSMNSESLLHLVTVTFSHLGIPRDLLDPTLSKAFLLMQFAMVPVCFAVRIDTWEKVVKWSVLSVMCFMIFAKFYSPQWILWISPLLVLLVRTRGEMMSIVVFDLVTYCYFPFLYNLPDKHPLWFPGIIGLKTVLLGLGILYLIRRIDAVVPGIPE